MLMNPLNDRTVFGRADAEEASRSWWIFLFAGIASIVFGALILTVDWSLSSLATFLGALFILPGASLAVTPPLDGSGRWSNVGAGVLAAAAGVALIAWPDKGLRTVGVFIGIFVLSVGLLHIVGAVSNRHVPNWWHMLHALTEKHGKEFISPSSGFAQGGVERSRFYSSVELKARKGRFD